MEPHAPRDPVERLLAERTWLRRLAGALVRDASRSEDLVQDAYVAALERAPSSLKSPRAWLGTVVRNLARNERRADTRRARREAEHAPRKAPPSPADVVARAEMAERVGRMALALDEPYRTTVLLRFFDDLSPRAIARRLDVPLETVRTRLKRALARLRERLDRDADGGRRGWVLAMTPWALSPGHAGAAGLVAGALVVKKTAAILLLLALAVACWLVLAPGRGGDAGEERAAPAAAHAAGEAVLAGRGTPTSPASAAGASHAAPDAPGAAAVYRGRVVDPEGRGVAGAEVALVWWADEADSADWYLVLRKERERRERPRTTTDATGAFSFDRPWKGRVWLRARAAGFATTLAGPAVAGSETTITMAREAGLSVRVADAEGAPVARAAVRLVSAGALTWEPVHSRQVLERGATDTDGLARLPLAPGGGLRLEVDPSDPALGFVERALGPGERAVEVVVPSVRVVERRIVDAETGMPVPGAYVNVLASGKDVHEPTVDVLRRRFPADSDGVVRFPHQEGYYAEYATAPGYEVVHAWEDPIRLPRAARITGVVRTAAGAPVAWAAILVVGEHGGGLDGAYVGEEAVPGYSDAQGRFEIEVKLPHPFGLPAEPRAQRSVVAVHPDHAPAIVDGVVLERGRRVDVTLVMPAPACLDVEVVDGNGDPCADAWIGAARQVPYARSAGGEAHPLDGYAGLLTFTKGPGARTDAGGRCRIGGLCPGRWAVYTQYVNDFATVDVEAGGTYAVRIVQGGGLVVTGRVLQPDGSPFLGQVVLTGARLAQVRTDAEGLFEVRDLAAGEYGLWLPYVAQGARLEYLRTVRAGEHVEIRLPEPARLRVRVEGPAPEEVECALTTATGGVPTWGEFEPLENGLTRPFLSGTVVLFVRAAGRGWTALSVVTAPGTTGEARVDLPPAGSLRARIVGGPPQEGLLVRVRRVDLDARGLAGGDERLEVQVRRTLDALDVYRVPSPTGEVEPTEVAPGTYEVSYGRWEHDRRIWRAGPAVRVEVRSGASVTTEVRSP